MNRLLLVEDDQNLGMLLKENLDNKGFDTTWCKDGEDGYKTFQKGIYDLCILDVMLPAKDGFSLAKDIRQVNNEVPFIFLTARGRHEDKVKGFETGCDDYIAKPFNTQELYLRINAILRRSKKNGSSAESGKIGKYEFDYTKMALQIGDEVRKLSMKEAELLHILIKNKNELVPRSEILEKIWGNDDYFSAKSMDVYMSRIRKLLKDDPNVEILNAYGIGFKLIEHT